LDAVSPAVRAGRDRLSRHEQGPLQRRSFRGRAGRRLPWRTVGIAAAERSGARTLAPRVPRARTATGARRLYMTCRLIVTLRITDDGPDVDAVYEDVGELDAGSRAGLKALYSDARKRAAVAAGIGAYLYTALAPVVLPIGPAHRQVQSIRRGQGKSDLLAISAATEQWLRQGYEARMDTPAVKRDLGEILAHGEPETGMGQGEAAEANQPASDAPEGPVTAAPPAAYGNGNGVVSVD